MVLSAPSYSPDGISHFWLKNLRTVPLRLDGCPREDSRARIRAIRSPAQFRLTPSFVRGWFFSGVLRLWAGQPDLSIVHIETSLRLSPRERMGTPLSSIGEAYLLKREFDKAVSTLLLSMQDHPGFSHSYRILAACYVHMGRLDEARDIVKRLRAISPVVIPSVIPYRNPDHRELFLSGLRLAAGETE